MISYKDKNSSLDKSLTKYDKAIFNWGHKKILFHERPEEEVVAGKKHDFLILIKSKNSSMGGFAETVQRGSMLFQKCLCLCLRFCS